MGIKHLWTVLTPFCERKPLYEIQGKTIAVDLSCWICEAQNIAEYQVQPRMYLRNLYFRTCYLLLMEVNPVFVLEGKAPELKYQTIAARNENQFKGARPKTGGVKTGKDRTRFHFVLRQCEEMLSYMGLVCIQGKGEAESLCAYLNEDGLVDGCISQDSDCFAYGAKVVYRNFSISSQGSYAASGGAVDIYDITKAYKSLNFGRNKIVAMALLCGSDYCDGVQGIGKESVLKLFDQLSDEETLERLRSWKAKPDLYEKYENQINDKNICTSCGHEGKIQAHTKSGCQLCSTSKGCDPFKFKEERLNIRNEVNMRNKALQDPNFPDENLINEYLVKKDNVSHLDLRWKQPDLVNFVKFTTKFLQWEEIYAFEKMLPILTRWQCLNCDVISRQENMKGILYPDRIKKTRNPKGISSYEIIWTDPDNFFKGLIPESQLMEHNVDLEKLWSTIEPQILIEKAYPQLVEDYKQSKIKPKKVSKRKKKDVNIEDVNELMKNTSISEPAPKKTRKPRETKKKVDGSQDKENKTCTKKSSKVEDKALKDLEDSFNELKIEKLKAKDKALKDLEDSFNGLKIEKPRAKITTLDNFLKSAVINSHKQKSNDLKPLENINLPNKNVTNRQTSTPSKTTDNNGSFNLDMSSFDDEDNTDLSLIVDDIISRKKPEYLEKNLKKINLDLLDDLTINDENSSSFFIKNPVENDLFERTLNIRNDSGDSTEVYQLDDEDLDQKLQLEDHKDSCEESDDSFTCEYVPLYQRLKKQQDV